MILSKIMDILEITIDGIVDRMIEEDYVGTDYE